MKTIAQVLLLALCFLFNQSKAQNYFNKRIDLFGKADLTANIFIDNNQYYVSGGGFNVAQTDISLSILKFDNDCNQLKETHNFQNNAWFYGGTTHGITKINDSVLCTTGFRSGSTSMKGYLYWFKTNLDSIRYKEYGFINNDNAIYTQLLYANKYHYLIGYTDSANTNQNILLIKTDTAGNEIWKKKIGVTGMDENAYSIDTLQGDLIIAGNRIIHNTSSTDGFVMRIDTAGNTIWQKIIYTNGGYSGSKAKRLKDGNILVYSRLKMYDVGSDSYYKLKTEKITPNNITIWQKSYSSIGVESDYYTALENSQGHIVIIGQKGYVDISVKGTVNVINQNGDSLFYKEFYNEQGSQNYFRDMIQAPDKGYCFSGFIIPVVANGGTGTEDIWLLKVDSNFCESAVPCNNNVSVKELVNDANWKVYPNPATNILNITLETLYENATINVMNMLGEVLQTNAITQQHIVIDVSTFAGGIYFLTLQTKDIIVTKKIIIEH